jgi:O-antigen ligase
MTRVAGWVDRQTDGFTSRALPLGRIGLWGLIALGVAVTVSPTPAPHILGLLLLPALFLAAIGTDRALWRVALRGPVGVLVAVCALSSIWSESRLQTLYSLAALLLESFAALAALSMDRRTAIRYFTSVLKLALLGSVVLAVARPSIGTMALVGHPWKGLFLHKNFLGAISAFSIVTFVTTERGLRRAAWITLAAVCLIESNSKGALAAAAISLMVQGAAWLVYIRSPERRQVPSWVFYGVLCGVGYLIYQNADRLLATLHRTPDLTGRTDIWAIIVRYGSPHKWFGTGIGGQIYSGSSLETQIGEVKGYLLGTTHNGFLVIYLGLGYAGLALFGYVFLALLRRVDIARRTPGVPRAPVLLALGLISCYATANLSEDQLLTRSGWFFLMFGVLQLAAAQQALPLNDDETDEQTVPVDDAPAVTNPPPSQRTAEYAGERSGVRDGQRLRAGSPRWS